MRACFFLFVCWGMCAAACAQIRTEDAQHIFARIERSRARARVPVDMLILVDISGSMKEK
jgi:hypothetical protein